ncbi:MAG: cob(I)yrinic acid a,c-diamide adenosyltransferase [Candidatus Levyibacteriota bacterium]
MVRQVHHKVKIYTKTGDKGKTSLLGGKRVPKDDLRIEVIGEIDELNSVIGIVIAQISKRKSQNQNLKFKNELINIQKDLFGIGSSLSGFLTKRYVLDARRLEKMIGELSKELPVLKSFILPGGGESGSFLHLARAVCRRAERRTVGLSKKEIVDKSIIMYLNRLSDLLFTMARYINFKENKKEIIWPS